MPRNVTLLELVNAVAEHTRSEAELIATVAYMVNRGHVCLCGNFKGQRFDLSAWTAAGGGRGISHDRVPSLHRTDGSGRRFGDAFEAPRPIGRTRHIGRPP